MIEWIFYNDLINFMTLCVSYSPDNYSVYINKAHNGIINKVMLSEYQKFKWRLCIRQNKCLYI